jgi:hypothetical protein
MYIQIWSENLKGRRLLGRPRFKRKNNIKTSLEKYVARV